ncbi:MAG TPA: ATP-grasp fold amidoligase family protein [Eudoraea sp.]|nr:ATP-grasp fold amidoligase family protein [Eudoraea sp.]
MTFHWASTHLLPDKYFLKMVYRKEMGKKLDLKNPITLNEKINWLKLYDRTPLHTQCADKYAVRKYVKDRIGEGYLVPLYFHSEDPDAINPGNIKNIPCIIKTNHDSSGGIFIKDLTGVDWDSVREKLRLRLRKNYYYGSKEWQYKNIKPRIIVEKLLQDSRGNIPLDYKLHCFNGKVNMIQVDIGRDTENHHRNWYSPAWEREPYRWSSPKGKGKYTDPGDDDVAQPATLGKMIALSEVLAAPFDYVRIDWYDVDGVLYFGEITFHHDGGKQPIKPEKWDEILGRKVQLTNFRP